MNCSQEMPEERMYCLMSACCSRVLNAIEPSRPSRMNPVELNNLSTATEEAGIHRMVRTIGCKKLSAELEFFHQ